MKKSIFTFLMLLLLTFTLSINAQTTSTTLYAELETVQTYDVVYETIDGKETVEFELSNNMDIKQYSIFTSHPPKLVIKNNGETTFRIINVTEDTEFTTDDDGDTYAHSVFEVRDNDGYLCEMDMRVYHDLRIVTYMVSYGNYVYVWTGRILEILKEGGE